MTAHSQTLVLNSNQIEQKITRIAHELNEHYHSQKEVILVGIANKGYLLAEKIQNRLLDIVDNSIKLTSLELDKEAPLKTTPKLAMDGHLLENKLLIVVDDVLNSGRTLIYACKFLLDFKPKRMHTVVLIDRRHRKYPIRADFVGLTLSTTLEEHITVDFETNQAFIQ